jgi:hypothetical protein
MATNATAQNHACTIRRRFSSNNLRDMTMFHDDFSFLTMNRV